MKPILSAILLSIITVQLFAQEIKKQHRPDCYIGIGAGLDYGGYGTKAEILPIKFVGLFAGIGYNLANIGFNGGLSFKVLPKKNITPTLLAMYGYNGVISYTLPYTRDVYKSVYYGFTTGVGIDFHLGKRKFNKLTTEFLVPFRKQEFYDRSDYALPFTFTVGFNFGF